MQQHDRQKAPELYRGKHWLLCRVPKCSKGCFAMLLPCGVFPHRHTESTLLCRSVSWSYRVMESLLRHFWWGFLYPHLKQNSTFEETSKAALC